MQTHKYTNISHYNLQPNNRQLLHHCSCGRRFDFLVGTMRENKKKIVNWDFLIRLQWCRKCPRKKICGTNIFTSLVLLKLKKVQMTITSQAMERFLQSNKKHCRGNRQQSEDVLDIKKK